MKALFKLFTIISLCLLASCRQEEIPTVQDDGKVHTCIMNFTASLDGYDGVTRSAGEYEWADGEKLYITFYGGETAASGVAEYSAETGSWVVTYTGNLVLHTYFNCRVRYFQNAVHDNGTVSLATNSISYVSSTASYLYNGSSIKLRAHLAPSTGRIRFVSGEQHDFSLSGVTYGTIYTLEGDSLYTSSSAIPMTMHAENDSLYTTDYVYASYTDTESRLIEIVNDGMLYSKSFPMEMLRAGANGYMRLPLPESCEGWEVSEAYEYVDLGLPSGLRWATCNVGADNPWEYGGYYAWGEVNTKSEYTQENSLTFDVELGDISGNPEYDAAAANWGGNWRMPTSVEFEELINNCTWTWTVQNGVDGYLVTGPNGNSIFLPAAGIISGTSSYYVSFNGSYWSSTPNGRYVDDFDFTVERYYIDDCSSRTNGQSIRPVYAGAIYESFSYTDRAVIESAGTTQTVDDVTIWVENHNGAYSLKLNRLTISGMPIGDVMATGITVTENNGVKEFESEQNITITASDDSENWMGPMLGEIPARIRGKISGSQLYCTISLTVTGLGEVNIVFGTDPAGGVSGSINGHEYVDLGLPSGLKWATCNIGADNYLGEGNWYSWGELYTKEWYTQDSCTTSNLEISDISGNPEYDVARYMWGDEWRMPTNEEYLELLENCKLEWVMVDNIVGYRVTGPNGNYIFLPASGYRMNNAFYSRNIRGYYWTSTSTGNEEGIKLGFGNNRVMFEREQRYCGLSVRPVYGEKNASPSRGRFISSLSELDNNTVVTLTCERGFLLYSAVRSDKIAANCCPDLMHGYYSREFRVENDGNNYYLYSVGAGKYVGDGGLYTDGATTPLYIEETGNPEYPWKFKLDSRYINVNGIEPYGLVVDNWSSTDAGNSFKIIALEGYTSDLTLSTSSVTVPAISGYTSVDVSSNIEWYAECQESWLSIETTADMLTIYINENSSSEARVAVINIRRSDNGEILGAVTVTQEAPVDVCAVPEMTTDMNDIKWYTIRNTRSTSGRYLYWAGDNAGVQDSDTKTSASLFYFTGTADACYIHNFATDLLMDGANGWSAEGTVFNISETPHESKAGVAIGYSGTYLNERVHDSGYTNWVANDAGSIFVIELVADKSELLDLAVLKEAAIAEVTTLATISHIYPDPTETIASINSITQNGDSDTEYITAVEAINAIVAEYRTNAYRALAGKSFTINTPARANGYMSMSTTQVQGVNAVNSPAAVWQFVENNGAVNIYNSFNGMYICAPGNLSISIGVTNDQSMAGAYQLDVVEEDTDSDGATVKFTVGTSAIHMAANSTLVRWDEGSSSEWIVTLYEGEENATEIAAVDLGLPSGLKWATCNVGASVPEEYGNYYAWGEINTKDDYSEGTSLTYGIELGDISGNPQYDAARANWGGDWRMPTSAEFTELMNNCTWTWTTQNGVNGYQVTGSNGNSIFLPAAGYRSGASLSGDGSDGSYWSSTLGGTGNVCSLGFYGGRHYTGFDYRYYGRSVRPVKGGLAPSVTLTSQNGLPGVEQDDATYLFRSELLSLSGQANKVRLTVAGTITGAISYSHVFFALSELAIYDADGQYVGYTATSNADHNEITGNIDGDGLPALNDGSKDTYFHSVWSGNSTDDDYHYIELTLERDVDSFYIEWSTRRNNKTNAPTVVGITRGTEYNP